MQIHPAAKAMPDIPDEEFQALKADIAQNGLLCPVELLGGKILDGRHRHLACVELGIEPSFVDVALNGQSPAEYVWSLNGLRRHLSAGQRAAVALDLLPHLKVKAKERQKRKPANSVREIIPEQNDAGKSSNQAAKMVGVNPHYVTDVQAIKSQSPELFDEIKNGAKTVPQAKKELKRNTTKAALNKLASTPTKSLTGKYDVVVLDPPWPMKKIERDCRPNQVELDYPTMSEEELLVLNIPTARDAHVWVWTTHKFLPMAIRLLEAWGLKYTCTFVWHKPGGFQPMNLPQFNCEFALYARKGNPQFVDAKAFSTCFNAKRGKHSEKPEEFYDLIRRVTAGRRLDMFARRKIKGYDRWGHEA